VTVITVEEQSYIDFDWFCVDDAGYIGHFTTAGYKMLPPSVAQSAEELKFVTEFFEREVSAGRGYLVDPELAAEVPSPQCSSERYLRSFVAMADRGLFSFDIASHLERESLYFRVVLPNQPLKFDEMPKQVQQILSRTCLRNTLLKNSSRVLYENTLHI
jgi:hypothetical protein